VTLIIKVFSLQQTFYIKPTSSERYPLILAFQRERSLSSLEFSIQSNGSLNFENYDSSKAENFKLIYHTRKIWRVEALLWLTSSSKIRKIQLCVFYFLLIKSLKSWILFLRKSIINGICHRGKNHQRHLKFKLGCFALYTIQNQETKYFFFSLYLSSLPHSHENCSFPCYLSHCQQQSLLSCQ